MRGTRTARSSLNETARISVLLPTVGNPYTVIAGADWSRTTKARLGYRRGADDEPSATPAV
jgi:hypothetical protein